MEPILTHAQGLVYTLLGFMPTPHQRDSLQALLGLFLQAQGHPLPQQCKAKSASALSRFLNVYPWSTRQLIRLSRQATLQHILAQGRIGRRPILQVILDLSTLEKRGKFKGLNGLVRVYHSKQGLHVVMLYLVVGQWRVPWSFRVYRGKDTPSPAQLGLKLVQGLPKVLTQHFEVLVLVDSAFGSIAFLEGVRKLKHHVIAGVRYDRKLEDGRWVAQLYKRGQHVRLVGLKFPVSVSWYYLKREDGKREKRYVLSTKALKGSTITR